MLDMLKLVKTREIPFQTLLMDSWYATTGIFKYLIGEKKAFYCPIKTNRKIDDTKWAAPYKQVQEAFWSATDDAQGKTVKLFKMPLDTYFKLFRVLVSTTRTDYIITNDLAQYDREAADKESSIRWKVEQLHREEKQISGIESCKHRIARSQRKHILVANLVWLTLKKNSL